MEQRRQPAYAKLTVLGSALTFHKCGNFIQFEECRSLPQTAYWGTLDGLASPYGRGLGSLDSRKTGLECRAVLP